MVDNEETKKPESRKVAVIGSQLTAVAAMLSLGGGFGGFGTSQRFGPEKPKTQSDFDALEKAKLRRARRNEKRLANG